MHRFLKQPDLPGLVQRQSDLLARARLQQAAARSDATRWLLKAKNLAIMSDSDGSESSALFRRAATEMGARVTHVRPWLSPSSSAQQIADTARMLGRLYDAIECEDMDARVVDLLAESAGVPVFNGVALTTHPSAALADRLDADSALLDRRRFIVQAILLDSIG
jgi:ornithine carbamoyltransferase